MLERIATRRRLRRQRRVRDGLLLDLGALVYELHRQGKRAPELLQRKAAELGEVDDEVRALDAELAGEPPVERSPTGAGLAEEEPADAGEEEPADVGQEPAGVNEDQIGVDEEPVLAEEPATDEQPALRVEPEEPRP